MTLLESRALTRHYRVKSGMTHKSTVEALSNVSFTLQPGKTLAVVGESGSGKSTLARQLTRIETPTSGQLLLDDHDVTHAAGASLAQLRRQVRMIFQNPYASLNPRMRVGSLLEESLRADATLGASERRERVQHWLDQVGLRPEFTRRYPHMFSGGQRQRIAIARALILEPKVVVADEPVSALDVSIQAQVLNLMIDLQQDYNVAYVFISHDLGVVQHMADEILVMYLGRVVEHGPARSVFDTPAHPYTRALLASTPRIRHGKRPQRAALSGELPSPLNPPDGCAFHKRCPHVNAICKQERPELTAFKGVEVACHFKDSI